MEDNKVLELLVQAVKNIDEKIDKGFNDLRSEINTKFEVVNRRIDETNRRIDETNQRIDNLTLEMNSRFNETNREIRNIKSREKHILDIAMQG